MSSNLCSFFDIEAITEDHEQKWTWQKSQENAHYFFIYQICTYLYMFYTDKYVSNISYAEYKVENGLLIFNNRLAIIYRIYVTRTDVKKCYKRHIMDTDSTKYTKVNFRKSVFVI